MVRFFLLRRLCGEMGWLRAISHREVLWGGRGRGERFEGTLLGSVGEEAARLFERTKAKVRLW